MSEKDKQIIETFQKVLPELTEVEKEKLQSYGEGIAFMAEKQKEGDGKCMKKTARKKRISLQR